MIQQLTDATYWDFVRKKRAAAVHFDAEWDRLNKPVLQLRMMEAAAVLSQHVNFGEVDCDREVELTKSVRVMNVPTVLYYVDG